MTDEPLRHRKVAEQQWAVRKGGAVGFPRDLLGATDSVCEFRKLQTGLDETAAMEIGNRCHEPSPVGDDRICDATGDLGDLDRVRVDLVKRAAQHPRLLQPDERSAQAGVISELPRELGSTRERRDELGVLQPGRSDGGSTQALDDVELDPVALAGFGQTRQQVAGAYQVSERLDATGSVLRAQPGEGVVVNRLGGYLSRVEMRRELCCDGLRGVAEAHFEPLGDAAMPQPLGGR